MEMFSTLSIWTRGYRDSLNTDFNGIECGNNETEVQELASLAPFTRTFRRVP